MVPSESFIKEKATYPSKVEIQYEDSTPLRYQKQTPASSSSNQIITGLCILYIEMGKSVLTGRFTMLSAIRTKIVASHIQTNNMRLEDTLNEIFRSMIEY